MAYTTFISYNPNPDEQVIIYRLQTLAGSSDINVVLPQRNGQRLTSETKLRIDRADSVIAFLTSRLSPQVREELAYAEGKGKLIIPICEKGVHVPASLKALEWIQYDPHRDTPGTVEKRVLNLLHEKSKDKGDRNLLLLIALGLGLLFLATSKD